MIVVKAIDKIIYYFLVLLMAVGIGSSIGYLTYRYTSTSRSADYTDKQRVEANQTMALLYSSSGISVQKGRGTPCL